MQLRVTEQAVKRFQSEWGFVNGDHIRIFVRYSGFSSSGPYSFGIIKEAPRYPAVTESVEGITFFMEENDVWFLEDQELTIDEKHEEIAFIRA
ncbi:Fe-S cluster assembly protein HesB [Paenibacillus sp. SC116]|uniref:HesB/YadR/YfhF family protein n=1 Tax=Paenibacillus sp. SC116 TaxID=2968986 RepID=UPI00215B0C62|nr:iron-sulfur cluster biosynthesis family protein [Paenibacillus sp. SC116]MCR8845543.1 Fe-S cluster assembly protein HesB [Paenibacillus sp. SC116]